MPVQIDRMDTSVEIMPPSPAARPAAPPAPGGKTPDAAATTALRETVGAVMAEELDRFVRNRGMGI
jgi:hypothetical protein